MYHFVIKANKPQDPFFMKVGEGSIYFYCKGLKDLAKTLRCITPRGFRTRSGKTILSYFHDQQLILNHPWFKHEMYHIKQIGSQIQKIKSIEFTNSFNLKNIIKVVDIKDLPHDLEFKNDE